MKNTKNGKIAFFCVIMLLFAGTAVFSQDYSLADLQKSVHDYSTSMALSLPFNSSIGLNWSEAHIGNYPYFGVGFSVGFTTMVTEAFENVLNKFDFYLPSELAGFAGVPIPGYTVEGRIGGFGIPFDVGLKFGYLPIQLGTSKDLKQYLEQYDYLLVGGDVRFAVLEGNATRPAISLGMGFNYMSGALGIKEGDDKRFTYTDSNGESQELTLKAPFVVLPWSTTSMDFRAQISQSLQGITPYLGIGASYGFSKAGFKVKANVTDSGNNIATAKSIFETFGINDINENGFESTMGINKWSGRLYGGFAINIAAFKIDLTALWNFVDNRYGVSVGVRYQVPNNHVSNPPLDNTNTSQTEPSPAPPSESNQVNVQVENQPSAPSPEPEPSL